MKWICGAVHYPPLLDPDRDLSQAPSFAVRTLSGVTEAVGTYYAVTEYKGQSLHLGQKREGSEKNHPPRPNLIFSAYLKKKKTNCIPPRIKFICHEVISIHPTFLFFTNFSIWLIFVGQLQSRRRGNNLHAFPFSFYRSRGWGDRGWGICI